ncbi:MAG: DUF1499 domain-containing protein [Myxococcota bacterium]
MSAARAAGPSARGRAAAAARAPWLLAVLVLVLGASCAAPRPTTLGVRPGTSALAPCPSSPNCVSSTADDAAHRTEPFALAGDPAAAWAGVREAVASTPRTEVVAATDRYLHAEATTRLMRYVDDLELLLDPATGRVEVRSASRIGYGDMGANAARVEALRARLRAAGLLAP